MEKQTSPAEINTSGEICSMEFAFARLLNTHD
jgi:hypothetical protein